MKEIFRLVFILTLICVVSGVTLAAVKTFTAEPIERQQVKFIQGPAVEKVLPKADNDPLADFLKVPAGKDSRGKDIFQKVFPAKQGGKVAALALEGKGKGYKGDIGVMVGIDADGNLTGIAITNQSETPGIGTRVLEPKFTSAFKGKTVDKATAVDGVSGATFSTKGVFAAVENAVTFYKNHRDEILAKARQ